MILFEIFITKRKFAFLIFHVISFFNFFRSNPLYNDNESYYPGNPRNEPTSSVFGLASTQSDPSSTYSTMTNSNENNVANNQNETPVLSSQNLGPNFGDNVNDNPKGHSSQSRDALTSTRNTDSNGIQTFI